MTKLKFFTICCCFVATTLFSQDYNFSILTIPQGLTDNANSVIRVENTIINMKSQRSMTLKYETAITVLNKLANGASDITIYYDERNTIKNFSGRIYDAFGNEIEKIKRKDFNDYSASEGSLYSDGRLINYEYTPTSYPYTVYYTYEISSSNTAFIRQWIPVGNYYQSVENSTYTFSHPIDIKLQHSESNFDNFNIEIEESPGKLNYSLQNFTAIKKEPYAPTFLKVYPNARLGVNKFNLEGVDGEAENWKEFGKWRYDNLNNGNGKITGPVVDEIKKLVEGVENPIDRAKIVYEFVQNKVRYISVQEGIGGWKPIPANEVHNMSYGDCKGLTNYTKTLLDVVGVESNYTVLWAGNKRNVNKDVFSMQGNHVILNLPTENGDLWLECTSQEMPFAELGDFTDDRDVLVITPQGGEIRHTRVYDARENQQITKGKIILESNGNIEAEVNVIYKGVQFDTHLEAENSNKKDQEKLYKEFWDNINNMTLRTIDVKNNKVEAQFEEFITFTATNYGTLSGERMIIPVNAFNKIEKAPKRIRDRKLPVEVKYGFYDTDEVMIILPKDFTIEAISNDVSIETDFGLYEMTIEKIDEFTLKFTRKFLLKNGRYSKENYDDFRNFWRKVVKSDKSKIVLIKK